MPSVSRSLQQPVQPAALRWTRCSTSRRGVSRRSSSSARLELDRVSLLVDESTLDAAPLLDEAAWPDSQIDGELREYWGRIDREE